MLKLLIAVLPISIFLRGHQRKIEQKKAMDNSKQADIAHILGIDNGAGKSKKKWFIIGFLIILLIITGLFIKGAEKSGAIHYLTKPVYRGDLTIKVSATGTLVPTNEIQVGSELSGIIRTVEVDYNDRVKPGQVMARLDNSRLKAEVMRSQAALASAKAGLLSAQSNLWEKQRKFSRMEHAYEKSHHKIPSLDAMDAAKAALENARAGELSAKAVIMESEATLKANMTDLSKTIIYSPINGIVLTRNVEPGQTVAASFQAPVLFTLAEDLTRMELDVNVDEADIGQVHPGQDTVFTVDAYPDRTFHGKILKIHYSSNTTDGVVTYETVIGVKNTDLALLPGMTASSDITVKKLKNVLLISNAALRFTPQKNKKSSSNVSFLKKLLPRHHSRALKRKIKITGANGLKLVWIQRKGSLVPIGITIGATNGDVTEVTGGKLKPGMRLITNTEL